MITRFRGALRKLEGDPATQYRMHRLAARFWLLNFAVVTAVYLLAPGVWRSASVLYLVWISLYSNWSTDAGAMSAADAATSDSITAYAAENERGQDD